MNLPKFNTHMTQQFHSETHYRYLTQVSQMAGANFLRVALFVITSNGNNSTIHPSPEEWEHSGIYTPWNTIQEWKRTIHSFTRHHEWISQTHLVVIGLHHGSHQEAQDASANELVYKFRCILVLEYFRLQQEIGGVWDQKKFQNLTYSLWL